MLSETERTRLIERLRTAKEETEMSVLEISVLRGRATADGREWAQDHAHPLELRRLAAFLSRSLQVCDSYFHEGDDDRSPYSCYERFALVIQGDSDEDEIRGDSDEARANLQAICDEVFGDHNASLDHPEYVQWFAEGALDVWDEVKELI